MEIKKVGVVGCGLMGRGIAEVSARSGYEVLVSEVNQELLDKGIAEIDRSLSRGVERGKVSQEDKDATLGRIVGTVSMEGFRDCNIVIEAIVEKMDAKKDAFRTLDGICTKDTILTRNTSCLSIT
jgi:3-hydroxybutyryl-CoA dehydrogenase